ncbi:MAG TPA: ABC-type transport auxiliary lipoprotein family protein [Rariglobus sp.]|jgi:ABC-type uncharacterized transport system auxiliary subunit|nr:ABC-type transport auxiliary lipoprotein family protein [Rariglobus sp.]
MKKTLLKTPAGPVALLLACGALLFQAGCSIIPAPQTDPTHYYVLTGPSFADPGPARLENALSIGVRRVEVVPYLNGKAMIVRSAANEIAYQDYARWAELPAAGIERLVMARLQSSPKVGRVYLQPFPFDVKRDYDVAVSVQRCEGERKADGATAACFVCTVEITEAKPGGAVVVRKTFTAPQAAWDGKDFGKLAQLLSADVAALGDEIVDTLPAK